MCCSDLPENFVRAPPTWTEVPFIFYGPQNFELRYEERPSYNWTAIEVLSQEDIEDNPWYWDDDYFSLDSLPFPFCLNGKGVEDEVYVGSNPYITFLDGAHNYEDYPEYPETPTLFLGGHDTMLYALYRLDTQEDGQHATVIRIEQILWHQKVACLYCSERRPDAHELYGTNESYLITEVTFFEDNTLRVASGKDVRFRDMTEEDGIDYTDQFMTGITDGEGKWIVRGDNDAPNPPPHEPGRAVLYSKISGCDPFVPSPTRHYNFRPDSLLANDGSDGPAHPLEVRSSSEAEAQSVACDRDDLEGCFAAVGTGRAVIPGLDSAEYSEEGWTLCMRVKMAEEPYTFMHWGKSWEETFWYLGYVESFGGYFFPTARGHDWEATSQVHVAEGGSEVFAVWRQLCWVMDFTEGKDWLFLEGQQAEAPFRFNNKVSVTTAREPFSMAGVQDIELGSSAWKTILFADVRLYDQPLSPAQINCAVNRNCPGATTSTPAPKLSEELPTEIPSRRSLSPSTAPGSPAASSSRTVLLPAVGLAIVVLAAAILTYSRRGRRVDNDELAYEPQEDAV